MNQFKLDSCDFFFSKSIALKENRQETKEWENMVKCKGKSFFFFKLNIIN